MLLALKLIMTPLLIASVTLAGRRWGPAVGGWLLSFPLTSGPISILLYLQYGREFAARAAVGNLGGQAAVCVFGLAYCLAAPLASWPVSVAAALGAFFLTVAAWNAASLALLPAFALAVGIEALILLLIPRRAGGPAAAPTPHWDLPARMGIAAIFVAGLTTAANSLGPQLSGLLSHVPVFGVVIAAFTHRNQGASAAVQLQRGIVMGSFATSCFFLVVAGLLPILDAGWTYPAATLAALAVNGVSLYILRQEPLPAAG